jgi:hypothetical protein
VGPTEFAKSSRAAARGDFSSLETALTSAERRRATLQAELAQLDGGQQSAGIPLTPAALERHLEGMAEKLRSGDTGRVREAIRATIENTMVGEDGTLTLAVKPEGLLGAQTAIAHSGCRGTGTHVVRMVAIGQTC